MTIKSIYPVTRIHEPMRVEVDVQGGKVVDAWIGARLYRGFESMLTGRDPRDAALFTQRICGICSSAHAIVASMAQQQAFKVAPTPNGQYLTNLIAGADFIQNHLRHFYLLVLPDYVSGPNMAPFAPRPDGDYRLPKKINDELFSHVKHGIDMSARAHEAMAVFGAKAPHQQTIVATGITERSSSERLMAYASIIRDITDWVEKVHIPDVLILADYYKDYFQIGRGNGHFMSYGAFPEPVTGKRALPAGILFNNGTIENLDTNKITEHVRHSWYRDDRADRNPAEGRSDPDVDKANAYTWAKAPRYNGLPVETGPLARGFISGDYRRGISVMDRLLARAHELLKICRLTEGWLAKITPGGPSLMPYTPPPQGEGVGLTEAMRGSLGHWFSYQDSKVLHYQVITPTAWNFSPRDSQGVRGPVEQALIGTSVANPDSLIEVGRVIRSFDPCFTCAAHLITAPPDKVLII